MIYLFCALLAVGFACFYYVAQRIDTGKDSPILLPILMAGYLTLIIDFSILFHWLGEYFHDHK